jgi:hypothetical protein
MKFRILKYKSVVMENTVWKKEKINTVFMRLQLKKQLMHRVYNLKE